MASAKGYSSKNKRKRQSERLKIMNINKFTNDESPAIVIDDEEDATPIKDISTEKVAAKSPATKKRKETMKVVKSKRQRVAIAGSSTEHKYFAFTGQKVGLRASPANLINLISMLTEEQRNSVKHMGFGDILSLKLNTIPTSFGYWLLKNYDAHNDILNDGTHQFRITESLIHRVFGLPIGGTIIEEKLKPNSSYPVVAEWRRQFRNQMPNKISVKAFYNYLQSQNEQKTLEFGRTFQLNFLVMFCTIMCETMKSNTVNQRVLGALTTKIDVKKLNWCEYTLRCLKRTRIGWNNNENDLFNGSLLLLSVLYAFEKHNAKRKMSFSKKPMNLKDCDFNKMIKYEEKLKGTITTRTNAKRKMSLSKKSMNLKDCDFNKMIEYEEKLKDTITTRTKTTKKVSTPKVHEKPLLLTYYEVATEEKERMEEEEEEYQVHEKPLLLTYYEVATEEKERMEEEEEEYQIEEEEEEEEEANEDVESEEQQRIDDGEKYNEPLEIMEEEEQDSEHVRIELINKELTILHNQATKVQMLIKNAIEAFPSSSAIKFKESEMVNLFEKYRKQEEDTHAAYVEERYVEEREGDTIAMAEVAKTICGIYSMFEPPSSDLKISQLTHEEVQQKVIDGKINKVPELTIQKETIEEALVPAVVEEPSKIEEIQEPADCMW